MADIRFGAFSNAIYGDVVQRSTPASKGLSLVETNIYSGKAQAETDPSIWGTKTEMRLWKDGIPATGLINNKLYENGKELSKEAIQAGSNVNYAGIAGELATLGLRTPVGTGGSQFVRDAAAEKKFVETVRANIKAGRMAFDGVAGTGRGPGGDKPKTWEETNKLFSEASDEELIASVGGVNKEGVIGSGYGINALYDPYGSGRSAASLPGTTGYGTGEYGGTGPAPYVRGSRQIVDKDIQELANMSGKLTTDKAAAARANQQLLSIFQNDPSWMRKEQARDAMFLLAEAQVNEQGDRVMSFDASGKLTGPDGRPITTGAQGAGSTGAGATVNTDVRGSGTYNSPLTFNNTPYTGEYNGITYVNGVSTVESGKRENRQSAYDSLLAEFNKYGLGSLVADIKGLIEKDVSPSQFIIELRNTKAYQERFKSNTERIKKGLAALSEANYIANEDAYRNTLRLYGLTQFDNDEYVSQFIANDIRPEELGERVSLAVNRIKMADPAITQTLRDYYGLQDADMVAAVLDPKTQLPKIQRQISASEIGVAAGRQGFNIGPTVAEQLASQGITEAQAQTGYANIANILPTAEKLSDIYGTTLERYDLAQAEQEQFNKLASAQRRRQRLAEREIAEFSGSSGVGRGSLSQNLGGQY